jgi:hypothetical protein
MNTSVAEKAKTTERGVNKQVFSGVMWLSLVFLILAVFICLLTWGLLELSVIFK